MTDLAEDAERALRMVREAKELSYDTETSGIDWRVNSAVGYVIGAGTREDGIRPSDVVYVPIRHGGGGNLPGVRPLTKPDDRSEATGDNIHKFERELAKAFDDRNRLGIGPVIGHHTKFDAHITFNQGISLGRRLVCTQNNAAILDEYARKYSLSAEAERRGVTAKLGDELYLHLARQFGGKPTNKAMENYWRLSGTDPLGTDYARGDGVTTLEVYHKQLDQIEKEELHVVAQLEADLIWTCFRMERRGIKVDLEQAGRLREATEERVSEILRSLPQGFNSRSPIAMKALMEENGHTDWPETAKGNPSFTEKWLKTHETGRKIIEIRQATNLINSFVNPLEERHVYEGRVHATLNQLKSDDKGTISGRFSCNDPNLQQVPKRNRELAIPFRRLFVADEGYTFWERDYSQCEPRLFAHYSGDKALLDGYNAVPFRDAHQVVADLLDVERDPTAKRMNMGIFTGMGIKAFQGHMGWSFEEAKSAWLAWYREFSQIKQFQDKATARLLNRGYVHTLLGRRCRLESPNFAYRATSKIIQGGNADILKYKMLQMDKMCEAGGDICQVQMTVHDSFNGQYQNTPEARQLFEEVEREMEQVQCEPFNLQVPFVVEGYEGKDWAEASFGDKANAS